MNIKTALVSAFALCATAIAMPANATVINWTLDDVTFDDGGVATGTFSTDSTTGYITSFDITTTMGSALNGYVYDAATSFYFGSEISDNSFLLYSGGGTGYIYSQFVDPLTSGGVDPMFVSLEDSYGAWRTVTGGEAIGVAAVPEPSTWAMMLAGFAGLGYVGFRARRTAVAASQA
jgi:hypothetical protein